MRAGRAGSRSIKSHGGLNDTTMRSSIWASAALLALVLAVPRRRKRRPTLTFFVTSEGPGQGRRSGRARRRDAHAKQLGGPRSARRQDLARLSELQPKRRNPGATVMPRPASAAGPCRMPKGVVIATSVEDLHGAGNKISKESGLTEKGTVVTGVGDTPQPADMLTGSNIEGRASPTTSI